MASRYLHGGALLSARSGWSRWRWDARTCSTFSRRSRVGFELSALMRELPRLAESPEILRSDRFQRIRRDSQTLQRQAAGLRGIRHDIIIAQQRYLIRGQFERSRRELQDQRLQFRKAKRQ